MQFFGDFYFKVFLRRQQFLLMNSKLYSLLLCLLLMNAAAEPLSLLTAFLQGDDTRELPLKGSTNGGTGIIIQATGIVMDITKYSVLVGDYPCEIPAEGVQASFISCITTPISNLNSDLRGKQIHVLYESALQTVPARTFDFLVDSTPHLESISPFAAAPTNVLKFIGKHRTDDIGDGVLNFGDVKGIYLGDYQCTMENVPQVYQGNGNNRDLILCRTSQEMEAGKYAAHTEMKAGNSMFPEANIQSMLPGTPYHNNVIFPVIESVSPQEGLSAGQEVRITGKGFSRVKENNEVTVAGLPCSVKSCSRNEIICDVNARTDPNDGKMTTDSSDPQVNGWIGGSGFYNQVYRKVQEIPNNSKDLKDALDGGATYEIEESGYRHSLETEKDQYDFTYAQVFKGYFYAPVSGNYQFSGYADDNFALYISDSYGTETVNLTPYIYVDSYMPETDNLFDSNYSSVFGEPIAFEGGKYYYMELYHINDNQLGYVKIRVEVPNDDISAQWMRQEINHYELKIDNVPEIVEFKLENVDASVGGNFKLKYTYTNPSTLATTIQTMNAPYNVDLETFVYKLKLLRPFKGEYWVNEGSSQILDVDGNPVDRTSMSATTFIWTVQIEKPRSAEHLAVVLSFETNTMSSGATMTQTRIQESGEPMSGTYNLEIDGARLKIWSNAHWGYQEQNIPYNLAPHLLQGPLRHFFSDDKIIVTKKGADEVSLVYTIYYGPNIKFDIPDLVIISSGLSGGAVGSTPEAIFFEDQKFSTNIVFNPVNFDFLYSSATSSQVIVKTNDITAVCLSQNCGYQVIANGPEITAQSLSAASVTVTISDPLSWNIANSEFSVKVGDNICTVSSGTFTSFACDLSVNPGGSPQLEAGDWNVEVRVQDKGIVPIQSGVPTMAYSLALTSVTPNTAETNGGLEVVIAGDGFPQSADEIDLTICGGTKVQIKTISNHQISAIIPKCATVGSTTIQATFKSQTSTTAFTYESTTISATLSSISPTSASPVHKQVMTILGSGFGTDENLVNVRLADYANSKFYPMRVLSVNDTEIKCGIPGGVANQYEVEVSIDGIGDVLLSSETANDFVYELVIESISPTQGLFYGGTLVTITGRNFSPDEAENLVYVSDQINWFCELESFTTTQITCRTPQAHPNWVLDAANETSQTFTMTSKLTEWATCEGDCSFNYEAEISSPSLEEISAQQVFSNEGTVDLSGLNLDLIDSGSVKVILENSISKEKYEVNPTTVTNVSISFSMPMVPAATYLVRGRYDPHGETNSLALKVKSRFSTSSYTGSTMGGEIAIAGKGFPEEWPSTLFLLVLEKDEVKVDVDVVFTSMTEIRIRVPKGESSYAISFTDPTSTTSSATFIQNQDSTPNIQLSTTTASPGVEQLISLTQTTLTDTAVSKIYIFNSLSPEGLVEVPSGDFTVSGAEITFNYTFRTGVYGLKLWFEGKGWGKVSSNVEVLANSDFTASAVAASYYGGRLTVNGNFISNSAKIKIGGREGQLISVSDSSAIFQIPALINPATLQAYPELSASSKLTPQQLISDTPDESSKAFDSYKSTVYSSEDPECYVGADLGTGILAKIQRVRYFPTTEWTIVGEYLYGAIFEASPDGQQYTEIGTVGETVHTGWNSFLVDSQDLYRYVRMRHTNNSMCKIAEIQIFGVLMNDIDTTDLASVTVNATVSDGLNEFLLENAVEYRSDRTPVIETISQNTGSVYGGETLTLTGANLIIGTALIEIDSIPCVVDVGMTTATSLTCTTGARLDLPDKNQFSVLIGGNKAITRQKFEYVMAWSDSRTWGTDLPPIEGDLVVVPKGMTLYVDESTPKLEGILVEGGNIVFADDGGNIEVHSGFITLNEGEFRAGTQEKPYQSQLTFIMYGSKAGRHQPVVGNKGIGCVRCKLSMYGKERSHTWTTISQTINPSDTTLTLLEEVDWQVGQEIVVASTDFDHNHAERRRITAISSGRQITVDQPFEYKHVYSIENYEGVELKMDAEVGLLTRNIKMKGDDSAETIDAEYGSHLMIAGSSEEGARGHIAYTEFFQCGQPQIVGRYCIHFHMNGDVSDSFVKGNAVHDSYARILTIHAVHYLHVSYNVGYRVKGHNFFIEDGVETQNILEYNLVISSLMTFSMMQTDISVASYWITNPSNHVRYNRAAGGDFYGFWYEIKEHPDGPSATVDICPVGNVLGQSHTNVAHSYKRFGLRIFHLYSRQKPCKPIAETHTDPNQINLSIQSKFSNYVLYKNEAAGLLAEFMGNVLFEDFVVAENKESGIEFFMSDFSDKPTINDNMTIIGLTETNSEDFQYEFTGASLPRSDHWMMKNSKFFNFPNTTFAIKSCTGCDHLGTFTNRHYSYEVENLKFFNISGGYLFMIGTFDNDVIYDLDGCLSTIFDGVARPSGTIVRNFEHIVPESHCFAATVPGEWHETLYCDETITIRGALIGSLEPESTFSDENTIRVQLINSASEWVNTSESYTDFTSRFAWKEPINIMFTFSLPYVTGRTYGVWFRIEQDFDYMAMLISDYFRDDDDAIIFKFKYTLNRELFEIGQDIEESGELMSPIETALESSSCRYGDYTVNIETKELTICASNRGRNPDYQFLEINAVYCRYLCPAPAGQFEKQSFLRYWSNATQWPGGVMPSEGDNITIPGEWTIVMDMDPALINFWLIDGRVVIPTEQTDLHIKAKSVWVRAGEIETEIDPDLGYWPGNLTFQIVGNRNDQGHVFLPQLGGRKYFVVNGKLILKGKMPETAWTHLQETVHTGDTSMRVGQSTDWQVGDQIIIGPTFRNYSQHEMVTITGIQANVISFTPPLDYNHFGGTTNTISNFVGTLDARAAVGHLTRNIKFISTGDVGYSLQIYGYLDSYFDSGTQQDVEVMRSGQLQLEGVEFIGGGQLGTENSLLKMQYSIGDAEKNIHKCSFHEADAHCIYILNSKHISITDTVFYNNRVFHTVANEIEDMVFQDNLMIGLISGVELSACFSTWTPMHGNDFFVRDNVCQGSEAQGFVFPHIPCSYIDNSPYGGNVVGSADTGFLFNELPNEDCLVTAGIRAFSTHIAMMCSPNGPSKVIFEDFIVIDSGRAVTLRFGHIGPDNTAIFRKAYISAVSRPSCSECYGPTANDCSDNHAVRLLVVTINGQFVPAKWGDAFDVICKEETFDAKTFMSDVIFDNFRENYDNSLPHCRNNVVFRPHRLSGDLVGSTNMQNVTCNNCETNAIAYFTPPNSRMLGWFGGCGEILCTGMNNYLLYDLTGHFLGFQGIVIANNSEIGDNEEDCTFNQVINGHICTRDDFIVLEYESIAPDFNTRNNWPVYLNYDGGTWNTSTNAWREWEWIGIDPLNKRIGRFISVVTLSKIYNMTFKSEAPHDMRLQFQRRKQEGESSIFIIVKLSYQRPNSIRIMVGAEVIKPIYLKDDDSEDALDNSTCGSNKYFSHNNTIHFVVTGELGCMVRVTLTNSVKLNARFQMDISEFFSINGETKFVDRIVALLGITDRSRVKVVSVYSGSVQIEAVIEEEVTAEETARENNNPALAQDVRSLEAILSVLIENGTLADDLNDVALVGLVDVETSIHYNYEEEGQQAAEEEEAEKAVSMIGIYVGIPVVMLVIVVIFVVKYKLRQRAKVSEITQNTTSEDRKFNSQSTFSPTRKEKMKYIVEDMEEENNANSIPE